MALRRENGVKPVNSSQRPMRSDASLNLLTICLSLLRTLTFKALSFGATSSLYNVTLKALAGSLLLVRAMSPLRLRGSAAPAAIRPMRLYSALLSQHTHDTIHNTSIANTAVATPPCVVYEPNHVLVSVMDLGYIVGLCFHRLPFHPQADFPCGIAMTSSPTCSLHCDIEHEYFHQAWRKWDHVALFMKFAEAGDNGRGIFTARKLLEKILIPCDHECFGENQRRKARFILKQLDQVRLGLSYLAVVRITSLTPGSLVLHSRLLSPRKRRKKSGILFAMMLTLPSHLANTVP